MIGAGGTLPAPPPRHRSKWARHHQPVSPYLPYTAAYLHHLFKAKEPLSTILFTQHNLCFMQVLGLHTHPSLCPFSSPCSHESTSTWTGQPQRP